MERITVGSVKINNFILGAGRLGDIKYKKDCFKNLDRYFDLCYNTLDVARSYENGQAEEFLGEYLKNRNRHEYILISKGGFPEDKTKMYLPRLSKNELQKDLDTSLKALKTDYTDIYFLHRDDITKKPEELIETANLFIKQGKTKEIGASNWTAGRIQQANEYAVKNGLKPFSVSQINYSYALTTPALTGDLTHITMNDIEYLWYKETQFPIIAYSVQAKGFFTKLITGETLKPSGQKSYLPIKENFRRFDRINQLSKEKNESIPALLLAYVLSKGLNASVIGGFSKEEQLMEAEKGINIRLSEKEIHFLETGI
ncbi:MAG: aldo/keto reductase [Clostridiales bacterium]|nr:aldo/keto reductase [Clostridiales bacterium]